MKESLLFSLQGFVILTYVRTVVVAVLDNCSGRKLSQSADHVGIFYLPGI